GFGIAVGLALLSVSRNRVIGALSRGWMEATRALPMLLILYFLFLYLPYINFRIPIFWILAIGMVIPIAALMGIILRSCLLATPSGQVDAGLAVGLTRRRTMRLIVMPQALTSAMPALISQMIYLFKSSTLGYVLSYGELLFQTRILA